VSLVDALVEAVALKRVTRAGWIRHGIPTPESVAAHSWGVAWLVTVLLPPGMDLGRALSYAVLHDLAEVRTGDITPHDRVSAASKAELEDRAMASLTNALPAHLYATWRAYEAQADDEARFVRQLDRLDMAIQAVAYQEHGDLREFLRSAAAVIAHPALVPLLGELTSRVAHHEAR
jgi:putative hydrolase of HD superfamily